MKTKLTRLLLILLFIGCDSPQQNDDTSVDTNNEGSVAYNPSSAIWSFEYNQESEDFEMKQLRAVDNDTLTGEGLEKIINNTWPKVQIKFKGTSNDTAFIAIPDPEVLTQQMGSAGAKGFMISTTFSLTELRGISYVSFDFKEGDHARPGVYNRYSWEKNKIISKRKINTKLVAEF